MTTQANDPRWRQSLGANRCAGHKNPPLIPVRVGAAVIMTKVSIACFAQPGRPVRACISCRNATANRALALTDNGLDCRKDHNCDRDPICTTCFNCDAFQCHPSGTCISETNSTFASRQSAATCISCEMVPALA